MLTLVRITHWKITHVKSHSEHALIILMNQLTCSMFYKMHLAGVSVNKKPLQNNRTGILKIACVLINILCFNNLLVQHFYYSDGVDEILK